MFSRTKMRIAGGVAAAAMAVGGTAVAAGVGPGDGLYLTDPGEREAELATELAERLGGVGAAEIERALADIREEKLAEHEQQFAEDIAEHLEGVSAAEIADALAVARAEVEASSEQGKRPPDLEAILAEELGLEREAVRKALRAQFDEAVEQMHALHPELEESKEPGPSEYAIPVPPPPPGAEPEIHFFEAAPHGDGGEDEYIVIPAPDPAG